MNSTQVFEKRKIAVAIGIDLAKDHCDVVAYNADNKICFTKANMTYPKLILSSLADFVSTRKVNHCQPL